MDDPIDNPDDDTTYVHNNTADLLHDLYDVENHTHEAGTIKYVQVFARAKSHSIAPHKDSIFKILLDDSACTDTQKSDSFDLITTYSKYSKAWNTNPFTGVAFTWANIDNYQCGVECNSPAHDAIPVDLTLRPNAAGSLTQLSPYPTLGFANWECVDEAIADDDNTHVRCYTYPAEKRDLYNVPNHTTESGVINSVALFWRCAVVYSSGNAIIGGLLKTHGTIYPAYRSISTGSGYTLESETYAVNPNTGLAWTWAEIDALEIGCSAQNPDTVMASKITQVYCVVNSDEGITPDIRTTKCHMKVNYDETVHCDLIMPEEISQNYAQNIKMLNHWSGNRSVYGLSKNHDTTVMTGYAIDGEEDSETFYFNAYDAGGEEWTTNPANMVDGNDTIFASTTVDNDVELLLSNTANDTDYGNCTKKIVKIEVRARTRGTTSMNKLILRPVFINGDGDNHSFFTAPAVTNLWTPWYDITTDTNAPSEWTWNDVKSLNMDVQFDKSSGTIYCSIVELRITYYNDACCQMKCVESIGKQGDPVSLTGLGYTDYDDEYQILSWGWKCISKKPVYYEWLLELERTT